MTCPASGGKGDCGNCDECAGRSAFDWRRGAGGGANDDLAASGQSTWASLGMGGWRSSGDLSVFCEMLERIAALLRVGNGLQHRQPDAVLQRSMDDLAKATWDLDPPQALREPSQMDRVEQVLKGKILPPVSAIADRITALSAPRPTSRFGFLKTRKTTEAPIGAPELKEAQSLRQAILSDGKTMTDGLRSHRNKVSVARRLGTYGAGVSGLLAAAPSDRAAAAASAVQSSGKAAVRAAERERVAARPDGLPGVGAPIGASSSAAAHDGRASTSAYGEMAGGSGHDAMDTRWRNAGPMLPFDFSATHRIQSSAGNYRPLAGDSDPLHSVQSDARGARVPGAARQDMLTWSA